MKGVQREQTATCEMPAAPLFPQRFLSRPFDQTPFQRLENLSPRLSVDPTANVHSLGLGMKLPEVRNRADGSCLEVEATGWEEAAHSAL